MSHCSGIPGELKMNKEFLDVCYTAVINSPDYAIGGTLGDLVVKLKEYYSDGSIEDLINQSFMNGTLFMEDLYDTVYFDIPNNTIKRYHGFESEIEHIVNTCKMFY